jgi:hypothetical protein
MVNRQIAFGGGDRRMGHQPTGVRRRLARLVVVEEIGKPVRERIDLCRTVFGSTSTEDRAGAGLSRTPQA